MIDDTLFPPNPKNNDTANVGGVTFRYDAVMQTWVKLSASNLAISPATVTRSGTMSAADLVKLNRLIIPPPISTLIGNNCVAPFTNGGISLTSGDDFINVQGSVAIQNINEVGDRISKDTPFQIHKNTFGYDFTVNLQALVQELSARGQINTNGAIGPKGNKGKKGPAGANVIVAGPKGPDGPAGDSIPVDVTINSEPVQTTAISNLNTALVDATIVEASDGSFSIDFSRQAIGSNDPQATEFSVTATQSSWLLGIDNLQPGPQPLLCVDVQQILDAIHEKYLAEVERLKIGYQDVVKFWITTMANLFDEQKAALCCALEFCISGTKSTQLGQHIENLVAATIGKANITLNPRGSANTITVSSNGVLSEIDAPAHTDGGGTDSCNTLLPGAVPSFAESVLSARAAKSVKPEAAQTLLVDQDMMIVDPIANSSIMTASSKAYPAGSYVAIIQMAEAKINGQYKAPLSLRYVSNGKAAYSQFLDIGSYTQVSDCKKAYEGLSISFDHDGGNISLWLASLGANSSGRCAVRIVKSQPKPKPVETVESAPQVEHTPEPGTECSLTRKQVEWYSDSWDLKRCCGLIVDVHGQDYIIVKRTLADDLACGGGNIATNCSNLFGDGTAFAWPTLDGVKFAPIMSDVVRFRYDADLNTAVAGLINRGAYTSQCGNPDGMRHLAYQLSTVVFPVH